jgi:hypothetical protein
MNRREIVTALALAATAGVVQAQPTGLQDYDYLFIELKPGSRAGFMTHLAGPGRAAAREAGGEIIGVFTPQLGWNNNDVAILIRWTKPGDQARDAAVAAIRSAAQLVSLERHTFAPTARPRPQDQLKPGGIYVHRWFEIRPGDREEFIRLSTEGWVDFEKRFATNIFGLFAETRARRDGNLRLLLLTRYADHGVWEASRDPTTEAMRSFQRRAQLTLSSRGCSTLLAPLPA